MISLALVLCSVGLSVSVSVSLSLSVCICLSVSVCLSHLLLPHEYDADVFLVGEGFHLVLCQVGEVGVDGPQVQRQLGLQDLRHVPIM